MTDLDVYQPATGIGQYQAGIVMTPESAKAMDEQVRRCTEAVLREGTDYGVIPGTSGEKTLWRPGAQKLMQWFGLGFTCERVEVERDDDGRKHGITYRAVVARRLPDGSLDVKATCEGTADYDESKFYQSAEEVQRKAEAKERMWAEKDRRVANPTKWKNLGEYRADWNALMKRAQKRAIVGAVVDATAAGGIFSDREEDDHAPVTEDDRPSWFEQALEAALTFPDRDAGAKLYTEAAQAHRDGLCTRRQQDHVQNRITKRVQLLKKATPVDVEDLATQAARLVSGGVSVKIAAAGGEADGQEAPPRTARRGKAAGDAAQGQPKAGTETPRPDGGPGTHLPPPSGDDDGAAAEDQPGSASEDQLQSLHIILGGLGFKSEDREAKLRIAETITGRPLGGGPVTDDRSSKNLSYTDADKLIRKLGSFVNENGERDRDALIAFMAKREQAGHGDD